MIMRSPTHGQQTMRQIVERIHSYVDSHYGNFRIVVGTDSQNFHKTKMVQVIAFLHEGKGGFFFYNTQNLRRIESIRQKLQQETTYSLTLIDMLIAEFETYYDETHFDYTQIAFSIHVDAGPNGKSGEFIPEIVGWIQSMGYICETKPDAFVASTIADKLSK